jgi:putative toxin-antitoxin system antitoxin component (TIGR02293 family)
MHEPDDDPAGSLVAAYADAVSAAELFVSDGAQQVLSYEAAAAAVRRGVGASAVLAIAAEFPVEKGAVLEAVGVDKATFARRERDGRSLAPAAAEGTLRTMELTAMATEVFGSRENAARWLKKPHPLLDGESPLGYATNHYAATRVKSMLAALRYGAAV